MIRTLEDIMHTLGLMTYQMTVLKSDKKFTKKIEEARQNIQDALEYFMNNEPKKE